MSGHSLSSCCTFAFIHNYFMGGLELLILLDTRLTLPIIDPTKHCWSWSGGYYPPSLNNLFAYVVACHNVEICTRLCINKYDKMSQNCLRILGILFSYLALVLCKPTHHSNILRVLIPHPRIGLNLRLKPPIIGNPL